MTRHIARPVLPDPAAPFTPEAQQRHDDQEARLALFLLLEAADPPDFIGADDVQILGVRAGRSAGGIEFAEHEQRTGQPLGFGLITFQYERSDRRVLTYRRFRDGDGDRFYLPDPWSERALR